MGAQAGRFRRVDRLVRPRDFQRVSRSGQRAAVDGFVVLIASREAAGEGRRGARLGITMSRRVGNAVRRNRLKRCVREWFRQRRGEIRPDLDVVVIGRAGAPAASGARIASLLSEALQRAGGLAT
jgi:ribonuclease P protein component